MGSIRIESELKTVKIKGIERQYELYTRSKLKKFNTSVLGLGDISARSRQRESIAAVYDLEGFTDFCRQVDPHLSVPKFLSMFLDWLFDELKRELIQRKFKRGSLLYTNLPFFAKFLGDGVLFLWDASELKMSEMCNVLVMLENICRRYRRDFIPKIRRLLSDVPPKLRCGVARGVVCSVGNGEDYVGPCINIAARLQKLSSLTFCFSKRGFDYENGMLKETADSYIIKRVEIRGVGPDELVCMSKADFDRLKKKEQAIFEKV